MTRVRFKCKSMKMACRRGFFMRLNFDRRSKVFRFQRSAVRSKAEGLRVCVGGGRGLTHKRSAVWCVGFLGKGV